MADGLGLGSLGRNLFIEEKPLEGLPQLVGQPPPVGIDPIITNYEKKLQEVKEDQARLRRTIELPELGSTEFAPGTIVGDVKNRASQWLQRAKEMEKTLYGDYLGDLTVQLGRGLDNEVVLRKMSDVLFRSTKDVGTDFGVGEWVNPFLRQMWAEKKQANAEMLKQSVARNQMAMVNEIDLTVQQAKSFMNTNPKLASMLYDKAERLVTEARANGFILPYEPINVGRKELAEVIKEKKAEVKSDEERKLQSDLDKITDMVMDENNEKDKEKQREGRRNLIKLQQTAREKKIPMPDISTLNQIITLNLNTIKSDAVQITKDDAEKRAKHNEFLDRRLLADYQKQLDRERDPGTRELIAGQIYDMQAKLEQAIVPVKPFKPEKPLKEIREERIRQQITDIESFMKNKDAWDKMSKTDQKNITRKLVELRRELISDEAIIEERKRREELKKGGSLK